MNAENPLPKVEWSRPTIDLRKQEVKGWAEGEGSEDEPSALEADDTRGVDVARQTEKRSLEMQSKTDALRGRRDAYRARIALYEQQGVDFARRQQAENDLKNIEEQLRKMAA